VGEDATRASGLAQSKLSEPPSIARVQKMLSRARQQKKKDVARSPEASPAEGKERKGSMRKAPAAAVQMEESLIAILSRLGLRA
jgi:hypothetical protein